MVVGYETSFPWLVFFQFLIVNVYAGGPNAVVFLLGCFLVVWFIGSLCGIVVCTLTQKFWKCDQHKQNIYWPTLGNNGR